MHLQSVSLKLTASSPRHAVSLPKIPSIQNPNSIFNLTFPPISIRRVPDGCFRLRCRSSTDVPAVKSSNGAVRDRTDLGKTTVALTKTIDVATLGNLCVDIVLNVPELPPPSLDDRKAYMDELSASPPDKHFWEAGGNCNMAIAAARLGLNCIALGHLGNEIYGKFLLDVLRDEGIEVVGMTEDMDVNEAIASYETLLCWVLVDPMQRHGFCSRLDFTKEPAFNWINKLSDKVKRGIRQSKVIFCNGYDFDELNPSFIISTIDYAAEVGTAVFFDPGPRGKKLANGTSEEQRALSHILKMSDVLLLTSDEAESLTGIKNPIHAGQQLLRNGSRAKWVIVKMGRRGSILITTSSVSYAPSFKVDVIDTVGCGDSFVAAIAFGFIHDIPRVDTLTIANAVGAATATGCGAGRNVAKLEKVIELMRTSNLNDGDEFHSELLAEKLDAPEISVLTKTLVNGNKDQLKRVSLQNVVSEMLPKLESLRIEAKLSS